MEPFQITAAIHYLRPNSEFSFTDNDYSTIKWDVLQGDAPTWAEIEAAHIEITKAKAKIKADALAKKAAAEAKLAALGLDADDLKVLGLA